MATWKKLIVSGSVAELAAVSASVGITVNSNQKITSTQADTRLTGSFTGSFVGDGTNLTGVTATAIFPTNNVSNLTSADKFFINSSGNNSYTTYSELLTDLAGSGLMVNSSDDLAVDSGSLQTFFNSSSYAGVSGDILINASNGVATIQANSVALGTDTTGNYVATVSGSGAIVSSVTTGEGSTPEITLNTASTTFTSGVVSALPSGTVSGSSFSSPSQGTVRATINGVQTDVDTGLQSGDSPQFVDLTLTGDITVGGNDVKMSGGQTALSFSGAGDVEVVGKLKVTGNEIKASDGNTAITLNGTNVTVTGDLTVNGTTTTVNTDNLIVEDKFALFASGSTTNTDGGILVQQGSTSAYALAVDASADRWALQNNADIATITSVAPDAYMGVIQEGSVDPASNPVYGGASGFGTIFVDSNTGNIWIYS